MISPDGFKLNWHPDLPDFRDYPYKITAPIELPERVDLRPEFPPVLNQGSLGSCVAHSTTGMLSLLQMRELKVKGKQAHEFVSTRYLAPSRLMVYFNARLRLGPGMEKVDSGCFVRDALKSLATEGVCREELWKYETQRVFKKPTKGPVTEGVKYKTKEYMRLTSLQDMKECLASGFPFAFGYTLYDSFYTASKTGLIPMPLKAERARGGHSVMGVGYDETKKQFIIRNSWGAWGDQGTIYMPYDYLANPKLSSDFWTIRV